MSCLYADMHIYCSYAYMLIYRRVCRWHHEALNRNPFEETFTEEKIKHVFSDIGAVPYSFDLTVRWRKEHRRHCSARNVAQLRNTVIKNMD